MPPGVVNVVQGGKEVAERLMANPHIQAVSFVGSTGVARQVYRFAAEHGKRVQALFGALNAHGPDAVAFYTRKKVVTERWFGAETPKDGWV